VGGFFYRRGTFSPIVQTITELESPKPDRRPAIMIKVSPRSTISVFSNVSSPIYNISPVDDDVS